MAMVRDRLSGDIAEEKVYEDAKLRLLYDSAWGRLLGRLVITRPWFSRFYARKHYKPQSAAAIPGFIRTWGIQTEDFEPGPWSSFADFFTRRPLPAARPWDADPLRLCSPADSRLLVCPIEEDCGGSFTVRVKNFDYTITELLGGSLPEGFRPGWCLIFRLAMDDCHRYYHADDGQVLPGWEKPREVRGRLHSVGPLANTKVKVLQENARSVQMLEYEHFGVAVQIEVGALTVGSIINHDKRTFKRGEEKGYFAPSGSTIVLLLGRDKFTPDPDLLQASARDIESRVRIGEGIGRGSSCRPGRMDRKDSNA